MIKAQIVVKPVIAVTNILAREAIKLVVAENLVVENILLVLVLASILGTMAAVLVAARISIPAKVVKMLLEATVHLVMENTEHANVHQDIHGVVIARKVLYVVE